jgi:hypothetical protein
MDLQEVQGHPDLVDRLVAVVLLGQEDHLEAAVQADLVEVAALADLLDLADLADRLVAVALLELALL